MAALWVSVLLALAAGSVLQLGRAMLRQATVQGEIVRIQAASDAAMNLALARLAGPGATLDSAAGRVMIAGTEVMLRIEDETGKINLNLADGGVLALLLASAGLDQDGAGSMAARILAWRAPSAHGPFRSVGALRLMAGMDEDLFRRIEPGLTVWSQTGWIDPAAAGPVVRAALGLTGPPGRIMAAPGHAYTVRAVATAAGAEHVAVVRLTGEPARPFLVYRWD